MVRGVPESERDTLFYDIFHVKLLPYVYIYICTNNFKIRLITLIIDIQLALEYSIAKLYLKLTQTKSCPQEIKSKEILSEKETKARVINKFSSESVGTSSVTTCLGWFILLPDVSIR